MRCAIDPTALGADPAALGAAINALDAYAPPLQSAAANAAEGGAMAWMGAGPVAAVAGAAILAAGSLLLPSLDEPIGAPYERDAKAYDPVAAAAFYAARLPQVAVRLARLMALTTGFNLRLGLNYLAYKQSGSPEGEPWPEEAARAKEALALATQLGPTFIKLAQALSIRTDLIPEAYALELRQLQDAVPPFDSAEAKSILASELGVKGGAAGLSSIFTSLSAEPLAAASIGQVYKGTLKDGREVAVKVQRPAILDAIALDLYLLRLLTPLQVCRLAPHPSIPRPVSHLSLPVALTDSHLQRHQQASDLP